MTGLQFLCNIFHQILCVFAGGLRRFRRLCCCRFGSCCRRRTCTGIIGRISPACSADTLADSADFAVAVSDPAAAVADFAAAVAEALAFSGLHSVVRQIIWLQLICGDTAIFDVCLYLAIVSYCPVNRARIEKFKLCD